MRGSTVPFGSPGGRATATHGHALAWTSRSVGRTDTHPMQCSGAKSFVDDLVLSRGVVLSRAAASLRSIET